MVRRSPYTRVLKKSQIREAHVKGMGDVLFKGFQCLNPKCRYFLFVRREELEAEFEFVCPECGFIFRHDLTSKFYDYTLQSLQTEEAIEEGEFVVLHQDYIKEAREYKYCIICNMIKPVELSIRTAAENQQSNIETHGHGLL